MGCNSYGEAISEAQIAKKQPDFLVMSFECVFPTQLFFILNNLGK